MALKTGHLELLAPAKDAHSGILAIDSGADAVYIGAPLFGARKAAGNSLQAIEKVTKYAHRFWAKVYVALNTLLEDAEVEEAVKIARSVYQIGVDGLIIQDLGLLECDLPPLPLIASTQMHNMTAERVKFLEQVGFKRAILARELSLPEIEKIASQATQIELECFVHGAICVSYSGRCYLSYAWGGRSGNRGQCAQPCRRRYRLEDAGGVEISSKHWLSLKDMNRSDYLEKLVESGIESFKIEGRLRDQAYVANVVAYYRQRLDQVLEDRRGGEIPRERSYFSFHPDVYKTFHRGYTPFLLDGSQTGLSAPDTPKMMGESLGRVRRIQGDRMMLEEEMSLNAGDGICFFDDTGQLVGTRIEKREKKWAVVQEPSGIREGTQLFRNHDKKWRDQVQRRGNRRRIIVDLELFSKNDQLILVALDRWGNNALVAREASFSVAENPAASAANIEKSLAKTGNTIFVADRIQVSLRPMLFLRAAVVNGMRREVLETLETERENNRPREIRKLVPSNAEFPETALSYEGNVLNGKAREFYQRHGVRHIEPAAEDGRDLTGQRVMTSRYCVARCCDRCPKLTKGLKRADDLYLVSDRGERLKLTFDCKICEMSVYLL